jgi:tetratricopeptide (TPR) repeat protein
MQRGLIGLALAFIALPAWAQTQQQYFWCNNHTFTDDQRIAGCTAIIQSGRYTGTHTLAAAYSHRAWAYHRKGEDAKGLPDAEQAVAMEPTADHFQCRAEIHEKLGQRAQAISDYRADLKLVPADQDAMNGLRRLDVQP